MARYHYWQFLVNQEGQPITNAKITIYLADSTTPVYVYTDELASSTVNTPPQVRTNSVGYFEFWIGDSYETYGYDRSQKFKIVWEKTAVAYGTIDYIDIFPNLPEVDETDTSTERNKTVSNFLAKGWEDHKDYTFSTMTSGSSAGVHNLEPVDYTDDSPYYNKLVSNNLINTLYNRNFSTSAASGSLSSSGADYYLNVQHNLSEEWPVVFIYNQNTREVEDTNGNLKSIESIDSNNIRVWLSNSIDIAIKVIK